MGFFVFAEMVLDNMLASKQLEPEHRERVQEVLLSRHRHQHEKEKKGLPIIRSLADIGKKHSSKGLEEKGEHPRVCGPDFCMGKGWVIVFLCEGR